MKIFTSLLMLIAMCLSIFGYFNSEHKSPLYVKLADQITAKTADKMEKEKKLYLIGTGGQMMNDIQMMMMGFKFYGVLHLEEARELLVYVVNDYLLEINKNEEIRPYLHEYPFTAKNIDVAIYFSHSDGASTLRNELRVVDSVDGAVSFYVCGADGTLALLQKESFAEAAKLVKDEHAH